MGNNMAFVEGQEYVGKDGMVGVWVTQTGTFHVVGDGVARQFTAEDFGVVDEASNVIQDKE